MRFVPSTAEMRAIDQATIGEVGLPAVVLMENAGRAVADAVDRELAAGARAPVALVCGPGNNGGDGFVAARWLRQRGVLATVYLIAARERVVGDARVHLDAFEQIGGLCVEVAGPAELGDLAAALARAGVIVDALFGTGLARDVDGVARAVIESINRAGDGAGARVLSIDLPSGLDGDRGLPLGAAVAPDRTIALAFLKPALASSPGFARAGAVEVAPIGIPLELAAATGVRLAELELGDVAPSVPTRDPRDHKSRAGHVLVVAGSPGKRGAGRLCALAALRAGGGLVTLAGGAGGDGELAAPDPVMTAVLDRDDGGPRRPGAPHRLGAQLGALAAGKRALAVGPGMDTTASGRALVDGALALDLPLVLDADGLNHLGDDLARAAAARGPVVMTPHPGEAARLLGVSVAAIEADRVGAARTLAERTGAVVVLKGARTVIVDGLIGDGFATLNPTGNPGLATAGTGDVLTGTIAGLLAQGVPPGEAARLAVYVHGVAGDLARDALGELGMTASDVLDRIGAALRLVGDVGRRAARAYR